MKTLVDIYIKYYCMSLLYITACNLNYWSDIFNLISFQIII